MRGDVGPADQGAYEVGTVAAGGEGGVQDRGEVEGGPGGGFGGFEDYGVAGEEGGDGGGEEVVELEWVKG